MPMMPAVLGPNTRLNNFRLNYLTADQAAVRPGHIRIILGGIDITQPGAPMRVIYKSATIHDLVFDAPNTCALTIYGAAPNVGQPLEVWVNSNYPLLLFNGELQTVERTYKGQPTTVIHPVTAIDDTARANRRRPLIPFMNVSASIVARELMALFAPGFSSAGVEANLPTVSITFDGSEGGMKGCLTALAKLVGGYWYFENKTLYFFITPPGPAPDPIDDTPHRFLHDPAITWSIDKSQVRTRVYGKGASTRILTTLNPNPTLIPVENGEMFTAAGGQAIAGLTPEGAACRVLNYTGVQLGGGGGLVGPGAAPSAPVGLTLADGAGIESGAHTYAITFTTAAGESLPGPVAAITVGPVAPPATAVIPGTPTAGGAVDAGTHSYGVTFVTATGETTGSPASATVTTTIGAGVAVPGAPTAVKRGVVGNLANGVSYRYQATVTVSGGGETLPGAVSAAITPGTPPGPSGVAATVDYESGGQLVVDQVYVYALSYFVGGYETALGPQLAVDLPPDPLLTRIVLGYVLTSPDARIAGRKLYRYSAGQWRLVTTINDNLPNLFYRDGASEASLGPARVGEGAIGTPPGDQATVTVPTSGDARVVGRKVYRSDNGAAFRLLTTIGNNTPGVQYVDNTATVASNALAPTVDTSGGASYQTVPLSGIPIGPANVTARKIYRESGGAGYRLVTTIANNTATTYADTTANAALGAAAPVVNTATANRVTVTLPLGGSTVTGRKLYRTAVGQSQLKLHTAFADNTTTSGLDTRADATLGANSPTVDTSGLVQPAGQVPAGSTSLILANPAPFATGGGWAVVGNGEQVIRYTGTSATALTGIPASGPGAIVASISYNSTVTAAPALVGVTGLYDGAIRNSPVHVWVQRDDAAAQAYMAALDGSGDGVYEHIWSDERRTEASLRQVCDAQLKLYSRPLVTVTYATRDQKTKSGKTVTIAINSPAIHETLTIQDVTITNLGVAGGPTFTVTASQAHTTLEEVLRMLIRKADA
jgi:hypothetical protein